MANQKKLQRPPFILRATDVVEMEGHYPNTSEIVGHGRRIGRAAGLQRIGLWLERLAPGERTSLPHAHSNEEEFVFVLDGRVDAWIDGNVHSMRAGDLAAFPAGTGIAHTFINNSTKDVSLLIGGDAWRPDDRIVYPLHSHRRTELPWSQWWEGAPKHALGLHDGLSTRQRRERAKAAARTTSTSTAAAARPVTKKRK